MIRVAFDIGGTFTDFVLADDTTGLTHALKIPTSSRNPGEAVIEGLEKLLAATGVSAIRSTWSCTRPRLRPMRFSSAKAHGPA